MKYIIAAMVVTLTLALPASAAYSSKVEALFKCSSLAWRIREASEGFRLYVAGVREAEALGWTKEDIQWHAGWASGYVQGVGEGSKNTYDYDVNAYEAMNCRVLD